MHLTTIEEIKDYGNAFFDKDISIENQEIINILDEKLTGEYRSIYLKLKGGSKINKSDRDKLYSKVQEILCQKNEDN
jgi:hypothetical protein